MKKTHLAIGHKTIPLYQEAALQNSRFMQGLLSEFHKKKPKHSRAELFLALYLSEHLAFLTCKILVPLLCAVRNAEMLKICFLSVIREDLFSRNKLGYASQVLVLLNAEQKN